MSEDNLRANPDSTTPVRARNRQVDALRASHAEETPRKKSLSDKPAFSEGSLDAKRDAAIEDAGDVCVLPWDFFTEAIFGSSPITNADVNVVLREFKKTSNQTIVEGKFSAYEQDPKDIEDHEDAVFAPITDIFDGAVEITKPRMAKKKRSPTVNLVQKPHNSPSGEIDNRTRPDSYSNLIDPKDLASILSQYREGSWFSIFAVWEFKKSKDTKSSFDN
ncbi:hypothetical protein C8R43DRAFT_615335 [Mycena crocata]|nr:hypothetical protein C8R43DRAFT_615335 [Mycena crocata]